MDWFKGLPKTTQVVIITIFVAVLALFGIKADFSVMEDSVPPAVEETSTDIEVGEIVIIELEDL